MKPIRFITEIMPYIQPLRTITNQYRQNSVVQLKRSENSVLNPVAIKTHITRQSLKRKLIGQNEEANEQKAKRPMFNNPHIVADMRISMSLRSGKNKPDNAIVAAKNAPHMRANGSNKKSNIPAPAKTLNRQTKKENPIQEKKCRDAPVWRPVSVKTRSMSKGSKVTVCKAPPALKERPVRRSAVRPVRPAKKTSSISRRVVKGMPLTGDADCFMPTSVIISAQTDSMPSAIRVSTIVHPEIITKPDLLSSQSLAVPPYVTDFDRNNRHDPTEVADYARDIFQYLKQRENDFRVKPYMHRQPHITKTIRALVVDWLVKMLEGFELNHETLYLATKMVDLFLSRVIVRKEKIQLVAAAAMLMASKYDVSYRLYLV